MATLDKVILVVTAVVLLLVGVLVGVTMFGNNSLINWLAAIQTSKLDGFLLIAILVLLIIYLILILINELKVDQRSISRQTDLGDISISVQTITELVSQAANTIEGINDVDITVYEVEPLSLNLELLLAPDYPIPELTESVQIRVSEYLQETVGVTVDNVNVTVKGVLTTVNRSE